MSHSDSDSDSALLEECGNKRRKHNKNKALVAAVIDAFSAEERGPNHVDEDPFSWSTGETWVIYVFLFLHLPSHVGAQTYNPVHLFCCVICSFCCFHLRVPAKVGYPVAAAGGRS